MISPFTAQLSDSYPRNGLDEKEVAARKAEGLSNATPHPPGRGLAQILRANVLTRFNGILGVLFVLAIAVGPVQDSFFGIILVVNTGIGIVQEWRAKQTLNRLAILIAPRARVLRTGRDVEIAVEDVVLDDVLVLRPGDQVAADGYVLTGKRLEMDESLLTGEADAVAKSDGDPVLSGSFVVAGSGLARATAVGKSSYAQKLQVQAWRFSLVTSELRAGTDRLLRAITWVMVPVGAALVATQLLRSHQSLSDSLRGSIAGVGAMVPEGLILLSSIAFAIAALRLAARRVLVQELAAVEGLARVDVLCIDKTGTLTEGGITLRGIEQMGGCDAGPSVEEVLGAMADADPAPNATMRALALCFPATEGWFVTSTIPFSSERKWSAVSFADRGDWVLGAPDVILHGRLDGSDVLDRASDLQMTGARVLLLASSASGPVTEDLSGNLQPVALVNFAERLRADARETLDYLRSQGVAVKVLSGDAPSTVAAVAASAGATCSAPSCDASLLGPDDDGLAASLEMHDVFGRVRPEQKHALVRALKSRGHVVAMLGDGVNDVQALKEADIGIAMGSGSSASRSVARIVLLDDDFAAIPMVLAEGRRVIANIERVANLFVTKTVYAAALAVVVALSGIAYPFFPRHLTIVSTFTIGIPGFFLALAAGAPRAAPGFLGKILSFALPAGFVAASATYAAYAVARAMGDSSTTQARTSSMLVLFATGLGVLALVARPWKWWRILLVSAMGAGVVPFFAIRAAARTFSLSLPPSSVVLLDLAIAGGTAFALAVTTGAAGVFRHFHRTGHEMDT